MLSSLSDTIRVHKTPSNWNWIYFSSTELTHLEWSLYLILDNFIMNGSNFNCSDIFVFVYNKSNRSARIGVFRTTFTFSCPFFIHYYFYFCNLSPISPPIYLCWNYLSRKRRRTEKTREEVCIQAKKKKQSEPKIEWKWQLLCKLMKNTGKRREETINIMSLFQHFGANHPLKCKIS